MEEFDEGDINIGADESRIIYSDDETAASNRTGQQHHQDAAFDYTSSYNQREESANSDDEKKLYNGDFANFNAIAKERRNDSANSNCKPIMFTTTNGQRTPIKFMEGDTFPRVFANEEQLKAKQKLEKKKAKKAAGWKKATEMEGHVEIDQINEILDYVGEKDVDANQTQASQLKKKLRKKLSTPKQKNCSTTSIATPLPVVNGKCLTNDTSSGSGDSECEPALSVRQTLNSTDENDSRQAGGAVSAASDVSVVDVWSHFTVIDKFEVREGDFQEVHRKKKPSHHRISNGHVDKNKPTAAFVSNTRSSVDPTLHKLHRINGHAKRTVVDSKSSTAQSQPKSSAAAAPPQQADVDLSLNSFPVLESQGIDRILPIEMNGYRNNDSLKDKYSCISSWAKIAAKPTSSKPNTNEKPASTPKIGSEDLSIVSPNAIESRDDRSDSASADAMIRSSSSINIEFGTVTSSSDIKTDQRVQDILSQSFTEGQNIFKCNQPRKLNRRQNPDNNVRKHSTIKIGKSKGVEFLDKIDAQTNRNNSLGRISFGFEEPVDGTISYSPVSRVDAIVNVEENAALRNNPCELSPSNDQSILLTEEHTSAALPQYNDILPFILAPSSDVRTKKPLVKKVSFSTNTGGFGILSTVRMLRSEWDGVMASRNQHGSKYVKYLRDVEKSNQKV